MLIHFQEPCICLKISYFIISFVHFKTTIMDKLFDKNFKFHVKSCAPEKLQYLVFSNFLLVVAKFLFWEENWVLGYNFMQFWDFCEIFWFPKNLSLLSNWWANLNIIFITTNHALHHLGQKKNLVKYQKL